MSANIFENPPRGTISDSQLAALDGWLTRLKRDRFNVYRQQVGIEPATPNARLSKRTAWLLMRAIIAGEAGQ